MGELEAVREPSPDGCVEKTLVIRSRKDDRLFADGVEVLNEAVHNALQFTQLLRVASQLCDRVELVEKQDARPAGGEIEKRSDVLGSTTKIRGDEAVESRDVEIKTKFRRDVSRETALATSRRAVHQKADGGVDAFCL